MTKLSHARLNLPSIWEKIRIVVLGYLGGLVIKLLSYTLRWQIDDLAPLMVEQKIIAFWHNRQLGMACFVSARKPSARKISVLISRHRDGRIIANAIKYIGLCSVEGSTSRGGVKALRALSRCLKEGGHVVLTPDGPRGPVEQAKAGVIGLAEHSGVSIYPAAFGAERCWRFSSWDSMLLPKPFSRVVIRVGQPIEVTGQLSDAEREVKRIELEKELLEVTKLVDRHEYS